MIYTSYFSKLNKLPDTIVPICICNIKPKFYCGLVYSKLAPKAEFLWKYKNDHDEQAYTKSFYEKVLNKLDPEEVIKELYYLSNGKDIALICYEKPESFCHRRLVADWLTKNTNEIVEEYLK